LTQVVCRYLQTASVLSNINNLLAMMDDHTCVVIVCAVESPRSTVQIIAPDGCNSPSMPLEKIGSPTWIRTTNLLINSQPLYR
jgi:hypothetical protein